MRRLARRWARLLPACAAALLLMGCAQLEDAAEEDKQYIQNKYEAVVSRVPEIDGILNENAKGWKTSRMNKVDLTILRLAVYELKWDDEIPVGVAINEAVELAKRFGGDESPSFVNGVLGKVAEQEQKA